MKCPVLLITCLMLFACGPEWSASHVTEEGGWEAQRQSNRDFQQKLEYRERLNDWYSDAYRLRCLPLMTENPKSLTAVDRCDIALQAKYHEAETRAGLPYSSLNGSSGLSQSAPPPPRESPVTTTNCSPAFGGEVTCFSY
jgi:hypothetical protein